MEDNKMKLHITGDTHVVGIIGDPIKHSLSPKMHNAAFEYLNLNYVYVPFHVRVEDVAKAIEGIRTLGIKGINVTVPHKVAVMQYLDEITDAADAIGAVNTIYWMNGRLIGDNTDGAGFIRALIHDEGIKLDGKNVVILGAGGSARAIGYALVNAGVKILTLCNRTISKAEDITKMLRKYNINVHAMGLDTTNLEEIIHNADIIVNTTSVGMNPQDGLLIPGEWIHKNQIVYDIIYNPVQTLLLKEAKQKGAKAINGLGMLIHQGALAFEIWTGKHAPIEVMKKAIVS
jgi:shikimate dehydrogenase